MSRIPGKEKQTQLSVNNNNQQRSWKRERNEENYCEKYFGLINCLK